MKMSVPAPAVPAADRHKGHAAPGAQAAMPADMAHEMGHSGTDLPAMVRDMRNRFLICLIFTVPIFVYAPMGGFFTPPTPPFGLELNLWLFFFASAAILYPSWPFFVSAWRALRTGTVSMAVLVVLSVGTGYVFSAVTTFFYKESGQFFEAASVLLVFILLGHWLEMRARAGASSAITALMDLTPAKASVIRNGAEVEVPTAEVLAGEIVVIRPGGKIPVDGTVETGESLVDESMITGESMPVKKGPGATVIGATINKSGSFRYKATKVGADTALAQIVKLVQEAQNSKAPSQLLADKAAQWLVIAAIVIGLATFAVWFWWIGQPLLFAVTLTITVFVIACPDAEHPHGLSDMDFDELFTKDKPVIFAFHAYPWLIHRLTYRRTNHDNIHVRGYKEEGTITTPFDLTVMNDLDRFHLVMDTVDRLPQTGDKGIYLKLQLEDKLIEHKHYIRKHGEDMPEIRTWRWGAKK